MAKITLKLNSKDLAEILRKGNRLEQMLLSTEGPVYSYALTVANGYTEAVISGMGKTTDGILTLKSFLGSSQSVSWAPNSKKTLKVKANNGWSLEIWKASGETEAAVKVFSKASNLTLDVFAGIDGSMDHTAYEKALRTEFGADSIPGNRTFEGRALFTLLNILFVSKADVIYKEIRKAISKAIVEVGWGI